MKFYRYPFFISPWVFFIVGLTNRGAGIRDAGLGIALIKFEALFPVFLYIGCRSLVLFSIFTAGLLDICSFNIFGLLTHETNVEPDLIIIVNSPPFFPLYVIRFVVSMDFLPNNLKRNNYKDIFVISKYK